MKNLFSIILSFLIISIIFYMTFLLKQGNGYEKPNFELNKTLLNFDLKENKVEENKNSKLKVEYLNNSDRILTFDSKYSINNDEINIEKWYFLFNFNSLNKKYKIKSESFFIEVDGSGTFFINNVENNIKIISLDNIIKLNFINKKDWSVLNTAHLYPNEYTIFDHRRSFLIKDADLLRITQIISLWYFSESIISKQKLNNNFSKIFFTKDSKINEELKKLFLYIFYDYEKKYKNVEIFKNKNIFKENENSLTSKYNDLLINKEKKAIFIKNNILENIKKIITNKKNLSIFSNHLISDLKDLQEISKEDYDEIENILKYFIWYLNTNRKYDVDLRIFFEKLLNTNFKVTEKSDNFDLNASFFEYNFPGNEKFYSEIKDYISKKTQQKIDEKETVYFIFFLNKLILANLDEKNTNFEDSINIFSDFTKVSIKYYSAENEQKQDIKNKIIETWISIFDGTINKFLYEMEKDFFTRNNWILVKKPGKNLEKSYIETLNKTIKNIYENFYELNKNVLSWNLFLIKSYENNIKKFEELYLALADYEKYLIKFDKKNNIFINNSNNFQNKKSDLSKKDALDFLRSFNQVELSESNIEIMWEKFCNNPENKAFSNEKENPNCYKITDMIVWNNVFFSFVLYPNNYNKIINLKIWSSLKRWSYVLDNIKDDFESYSSSGDYTFKDFFLKLSSGWESEKSKVEIFEEKQEKNESAVIRTLKNSTLLWKNWIFRKLEPILKVEYNEIIVNTTNDSKQYDIKLDNSKLFIKIKDKSYSWNFSWSYKNSWKWNSFLNPEISFSSWESDPLYWEKMKISWFIDFKNFENIILKIWEKLNNIWAIINYIKNETWENNLNIIYIPSSEKLQITSENVKFVSIKDNILNFEISWKKILENWEKMYNIESKLNNNF